MSHKSPAGSKSRIPLVGLQAQFSSIREEILAAILQVVESSSFIGGDPVCAFEADFAAVCQCPHAIGVANGTDALELVLEGMGIGPGDEVIVPTMTFAATAEAVLRVGAHPVFVDCDARTMNICVAAAEAAISERTSAVVAVHLYGQPADLDGLTSLAEKHGIGLIEDAAQAHGAEWNQRSVGSFGTAGTFSFYPGKNLGAYGDGGAVVTRDAALAERVRLLANHGRRDKYVHEIAGRNSRLDGLQAAILRVKLAHLPGWNARRRELAERYRQGLGGLVPLIQQDPRATPVHHLFVTMVEGRDSVRRFLQERGIDTGVHYPIPLHRQPAFQDSGFSAGLQPGQMEGIARQLLSLPMYPELSEEDVDRVSEALGDALRTVS